MQNFIAYQPEFDALSEEEQCLLREAVDMVKSAVSHSKNINGYKTRNFHAKAYGGILGEMISVEIPMELQKENPFPKEDLKVFVRFSNADATIKDDKLSPSAFGFAMKITDDRGFEANFPLANFPVFITDSCADFLKLVSAVNRYLIAKENDKSKVSATWNLFLKFSKMTINNGFFSMFDAIKNGFKMKKDFVLNYDYHSIGCFRFGDSICKIRVIPEKKFEVENAEEMVQFEFLKNVLEKEELTFDFQVQISKDLEKQPINDLLKEWSEDEFFTIAKLKFPKQKIISSIDNDLEKMNFTPFENAENLLPVGKIQRTRLDIYRASFEARNSKNL